MWQKGEATAKRKEEKCLWMKHHRIKGRIGRRVHCSESNEWVIGYGKPMKREVKGGGRVKIENARRLWEGKRKEHCNPSWMRLKQSTGSIIEQSKSDSATT